MSRNYNLYLEDIYTSIKKIQEYTTGVTKEDFLADTKTVDAVVRNLEVIGEASSHIPAEITKKYPEIEWRKVRGLRVILAHVYFSIDYDIIWDIIENKIPDLATVFEQLMNEI